MAKQSTRGDTLSPPTIPSEGEQLSDIILILDKKELQLRAVSEIDENGNHQTVPADKKHQNSFLKLDRFSNIFESFLKNFWSQAKDPTHTGLLTIKEGELKEPKNRQAIEDMAEGKKTDAVKEFLDKYEVKSRSKEQSINNQNDEKMAKQAQQQQPAPVGENSEGQKSAPRYNESMINWEELKNFGLSKEFLQEKGLLDQMLKGYKTNQTVPITMNFGSAVLRTDARLSFQQSIGGPVVLAIHGIRQQPELDRPFFGHVVICNMLLADFSEKLITHFMEKKSIHDFCIIFHVETVCKAIDFTVEQTAKLLSGKRLLVCGSLYSKEHKRKFDMENSTTQIAQDPEAKKLHIVVDGKHIAD